MPTNTPPAAIARGIRSCPLNSDSHTGQNRRLVKIPQSARSIFSPQFAQKFGLKSIRLKFPNGQTQQKRCAGRLMVFSAQS